MSPDQRGESPSDPPPLTLSPWKPPIGGPASEGHGTVPTDTDLTAGSLQASHHLWDWGFRGKGADRRALCCSTRVCLSDTGQPEPEL